MVSDQYVAGLLDGEGYVAMTYRQRREGGRRDEWQTEITVCVTMVDRAPLDALRKRFGGSVYPTRPSNERARVAYRYNTTGRVAEAILRAARPYLLVKHRQADLCLEQRENLLQGGRKTPDRAIAIAKVKQRRMELYAEMRELNRRGVRPAA